MPTKTSTQPDTHLVVALGLLGELGHVHVLLAAVVGHLGALVGASASYVKLGRFVLPPCNMCLNFVGSHISIFFVFLFENTPQTLSIVEQKVPKTHKQEFRKDFLPRAGAGRDVAGIRVCVGVQQQQMLRDQTMIDTRRSVRENI